MDMKISNIYSAYDVYKVDKPVNPAKPAKTGDKKDGFALSSQAKDFQTVASALAASPDIREDKVKLLKARMDANQYHVRPEDIAKKIVDSTLFA